MALLLISNGGCRVEVFERDFTSAVRLFEISCKIHYPCDLFLFI